jgi:predicted dehydrogenase
VVVGAGDRGYDAYTKLFLDDPSAGRIVAVAEPSATRTARFADRYGLDASQCHPSWEDLFALPKLADFALIATGDRHHVEPTLAALAAGYHVLLEKPMALSESECEQLVDAADAAGVVLAVCHVYRYSHLFSQLHAAIESGALGDVVTIQQSENVAFWHYAHSYVRGLTRHSSVPWLLQKSCHDLDLISWMAGGPPSKVSSFLRPTELTLANAPEGAPEFCIEGCPHASTCPYDAVAMYRELQPVLGDLAMTRRPLGLGPFASVAKRVRPTLAAAPIGAVRSSVEWWRWPVAAVTDDHTAKGLDHALRTTRWGRCAYRVGDNDQPSSQTVAIQYANGVNASFTLHSTSYRTMRQVRVDGTRGSAVGELRALDGTLRIHDHRSGRVRRIPLPPTFDGHGGGERPLFLDFLDAIRTGREPTSSGRASLDSHRIAFAAMRSAAEGVVVDLHETWSDDAGGSGPA